MGCCSPSIMWSDMRSILPHSHRFPIEDALFRDQIAGSLGTTDTNIGDPAVTVALDRFFALSNSWGGAD